MRGTAGACVIAAFLFCATTASADEPARPQEADQGKRQWYGGYTLLVDGISLATAPVIVGIGGYLFGTPIVHGMHHRWSVAALSFGIRLVAPAALGGIGAAATASGSDATELTALITGAAIGALGAIAIDAAFLAYAPAPTPAPTPGGDKRPKTKPAALFVPTAAPLRGGGLELGVGGMF